MVFKCFDEVDKTAWLYFLFAGIKSDFVDFFHTFVVLSTGIYTSKNGYVNMYLRIKKD